jgi:hypothetical protein
MEWDHGVMADKYKISYIPKKYIQTNNGISRKSITMSAIRLPDIILYHTKPPTAVEISTLDFYFACLRGAQVFAQPTSKNRVNFVSCIFFQRHTHLFPGSKWPRFGTWAKLRISSYTGRFRKFIRGGMCPRCGRLKKIPRDPK